DMPFIRPEFLDYAIERYIACERMALSVFIRVDGSWIPRSGPFELDGNMVVPSGISIINGECISWAEMSQLDIIVDHERQFLNINSLEDLIMAGEE
ncbi:MAG: hypothetical protein JW825_05630, partial [Candidatus Methanofastidiosa archaeon]|nr:hypothetical protein [Candidatus Methanofastidiosa archaeon]